MSRKQASTAIQITEIEKVLALIIYFNVYVSLFLSFSLSLPPPSFS